MENRCSAPRPYCSAIEGLGRYHFIHISSLAYGRERYVEICISYYNPFVLMALQDGDLRLKMERLLETMLRRIQSTTTSYSKNCTSRSIRTTRAVSPCLRCMIKRRSKSSVTRCVVTLISTLTLLTNRRAPKSFACSTLSSIVSLMRSTRACICTLRASKSRSKSTTNGLTTISITASTNLVSQRENTQAAL